MTVYAGTSFWFSLLLDERFTKQAHTFLQSKAWILTVSRLVELEMVNGLQLRIYRKEITQPHAALVWDQFRQREINGSYVLDRDDLGIFPKAMELSRQHSRRLGTRSLDVWHVAFAREKKSAWFLSYDKKQRDLARVVGMKLNPMN